jgi:hypothetical protein
MSRLIDDIIINIYKYCDFKDLHEFIFVNYKWFHVFKTYKQSISKLILQNHGYINFKKNTDFYSLLKEFYKYDSTLDKNIIKSYIDNKYILCKFIINNLNCNLNQKSLTPYLTKDINLLTDSIRDHIFINNKKGDEFLLKNLIIWKMNLHPMCCRYNNYNADEHFIIKSPLVLYNMKNIKKNLIYMLKELKI